MNTIDRYTGDSNALYRVTALSPSRPFGLPPGIPAMNGHGASADPSQRACEAIATTRMAHAIGNASNSGASGVMRYSELCETTPGLQPKGRRAVVEASQ